MAHFSEVDQYMLCLDIIRSVIQKHARDAQTLGKSLKAYLEDLAGYRRGGW